MLPAEIQRIVLLIGLAATGYLMILAWNDDYVHRPDAGTYAAAPEPQQADTQSQAEAISGPEPTGESDVPDASLIAGPAPSAPKPVAASDTGSRLVRVSTDVFRIWIDRLGGDLVRVELPEYPVSLEQPDTPYLLLDNSGGHTYIAQSGLIGPDGTDSNGRPLFQTASDSYELTGDGPLTVTLTADVDGKQVEKTYEFRRGDYLFDVRYLVHNGTPEQLKASFFAQIKRDAKEPAGVESMALGPRPYLGAALTTSENRYEKLKFDDLDDGAFRATEEGGWIAFLQHYFLSAWIANEGVQNNFYGSKRSDGTYVFGYTEPLATVAPDATGEWHSRFYAGPKDQGRLAEISPNLNLTVDYGFLWWLAQPLFWLLDHLHGLVGNWGIAIILLTVLVKGALYPLSAASYRSMANMRRVAPQMKRLQERYADDRQKLSQEMMALYKKENVNPLGGCLPMLLPMPIFIALYWVLFESVELRQAPFFLWINDLSVMDPFFVLPLLMGGSMFVQQLLSPAVGDPMQVRMMKLMPIMFTVLFLFFPAGLVLYWLVNNLLGIAQQWYVMKQTESAQSAKA